MSKYSKCPYCGSHLDHNEKCECRTKKATDKPSGIDGGNYTPAAQPATPGA